MEDHVDGIWMIIMKMKMMMMIRMTMGIMKIEGPESSGPCQSLHLFDCLEVVRLFPQLL